MIIYVHDNIFKSPATVIVNTVNTVGVMGKGLAYEFKRLFPDMYKDYRKLCKTDRFHVGQLLLYKHPRLRSSKQHSDKWVLNFPTKRSWRQNSKLPDIAKGLSKFRNTYKKLGITSIAFPELGVGNGKLDWKRQIKPLMEKYLSGLPIYIYIYLYHENSYLDHDQLRISVEEPLDELKRLKRLRYSNVMENQLRPKMLHHSKIIDGKSIKMVAYPKSYFKQTKPTYSDEMARAFEISSGRNHYYLTRGDVEGALNVLNTNRILLHFNYPSVIASHYDYKIFNWLLRNIYHVNYIKVNLNGPEQHPQTGLLLAKM